MNPEASPFQLQPTLHGQIMTLRPLMADDFELLYTVASDPLIWEQHPEPERCQRPVFQRWFTAALASGGALVAVDARSGELIGSSRYYHWDPGKREIAIGFTFLSRAFWGGPANAEMKRLMLHHAFRWAGKVWLHIGPENWRSRKAAEKIGAIWSHDEEKQSAGKVTRNAWYFLTPDSLKI